MIRIELTEEEAKVVEDYLFRKVCRLDEAGLSDSRCRPLLDSVRRKLTAASRESAEGR